MLGHCLSEVKPDFQMVDDMESVFFSAREELFVVRRKELELNEKNTHLEYQFGQLMEQLDKNRETVELLNAEIGKLQGEVEQEKTRELERCLSELQEKAIALEAAESRNAELTQAEIFSNSLQEALSQRDMILQKCAEILSLGLPEVAQFPDFESQISWLVESYNEKDNLNEELKDLTCKYEGIVEEKNQMVAMTKSSPIDNELDLDNRSNEKVKVSEELRVIKDEKDSLQTNLLRSEEKASLLREKLSMAVKKGKGLVQERKNLKQQITDKNAQIEALMAVDIISTLLFVPM
ncbi:hypothetical protein Tco_1118662 [Tanacetum coccineum]